MTCEYNKINHIWVLHRLNWFCCVYFSKVLLFYKPSRAQHCGQISGFRVDHQRYWPLLSGPYWDLLIPCTSQVLLQPQLTLSWWALCWWCSPQETQQSHLRVPIPELAIGKQKDPNFVCIQCEKEKAESMVWCKGGITPLLHVLTHFKVMTAMCTVYKLRYLSTVVSLSLNAKIYTLLATNRRVGKIPWRNEIVAIQQKTITPRYMKFCLFQFRCQAILTMGTQLLDESNTDL